MSSLTNVRPTPNPTPALARARTVLPAATVLVAMALSTLPTPLYPRYERTLGLGPFGITGIFAAFAVGAVGGLLLVERRGTRPDRRMVAAAGATAAAAALALAADGPLATFAAARLLSGAGAGTGAAVATAVVLSAAADLPPAERRAWTTLTPGLSMLGLAAGPLTAGVLTGAAHWSVPATFLLVAVAAVLVTTGLLLCGGDGPTGGDRSAPGDPARTDVARHLRWTALAAFATTGVFGALTPTLLHSVVAAPSTLVLGCCASAPFAAGAVGAVVRLRPGAGAAAVGAGLLGLLAAVETADLAVFVVASTLSGLGAGTLFRVALTDALRATTPADRRRTSAVVLRWAYTGLSVPVLGLGLAVDRLGSVPALAGFSLALVAVVTLAVVRPRAAWGRVGP